MTFEVSLILQSLPAIAGGAGLTVRMLLLSLAVGMVVAVVTVLMRISGAAWLAWPAAVYIYVFRGTPLLVQIFLVYYGLPQFEWVQNSPLWPILREPFWCAVIAFTLCNGAYTAEILRGGIQGVDKGLHDAAWSLGLTRAQRFLYITAPIAIRLSLPAYGNEMISMLKGTALASTITLLEVTGVARTIVARTFAPYEIFISAALVYVAMTWVIERAVALTERRFSRYVRR